MKSFLEHIEYIEEAREAPLFIAEGRDAPLYHGADMQTAAKIINSRRLKQLKTPVSPGGYHDGIRAISFSRDIRHAASFGDVIFVFDQAKLTNHFSIQPYRNQKSYIEGGIDKKGVRRYDEKEERVYMAKDQLGIPLDPYCTGIYLAGLAYHFNDTPKHSVWDLFGRTKSEKRAYQIITSHSLYKGGIKSLSYDVACPPELRI